MYILNTALLKKQEIRFLHVNKIWWVLQGVWRIDPLRSNTTVKQSNSMTTLRHPNRFPSLNPTKTTSSSALYIDFTKYLSIYNVNTFEFSSLTTTPNLTFEEPKGHAPSTFIFVHLDVGASHLAKSLKGKRMDLFGSYQYAPCSTAQRPACESKEEAAFLKTTPFLSF